MYNFADIKYSVKFLNQLYNYNVIVKVNLLFLLLGNILHELLLNQLNRHFIFKPYFKFHSLERFSNFKLKICRDLEVHVSLSQFQAGCLPYCRHLQFPPHPRDGIKLCRSHAGHRCTRKILHSKRKSTYEHFK